MNLIIHIKFYYNLVFKFDYALFLHEILAKANLTTKVVVNDYQNNKIRDTI